LRHGFTWDLYDQLVDRKGGNPTKAAFVMREATGALEKFVRSGDNAGRVEKFSPFDYYAAAMMIDPQLVKESVKKHVSIELGGFKARGMTVIDWYDKESDGKHNCELI
jgi:inosine-uridine nucleoside N-ribohydrolase